MKLTPTQHQFLKRIANSHVDYTTIGRQMAMARRLEKAGLVKIVHDYFAYITDAGRAAVSQESGETG